MAIELNTIYNEDCLTTMGNLWNSSIDLILSDIPYGIEYKSNMRGEEDTIGNDKLEEWLECLPKWFAEMQRILKWKGVCAIFCAGGNKIHITAQLIPIFTKYFSLVNTIIWDKQKLGFGWRYRGSYEMVLVGAKTLNKEFNWYSETKDVSNIIREQAAIPQFNEHPTKKPIPLMKKFISLHTQKNDVVYDPFMGGGSTIVAAELMNRQWIGSELVPEYCEIAKKQIEIIRSQESLKLE
jgi:site-specific DNA-methyltransferase (adenine-specific)